MFEQFKDWIMSVLPAERYTQMNGEWVEQPNDRGKRYVVIIGAGGPPTDVEDRRTRYRVLLVGQRNNRDDADLLRPDVELLVKSAMSGLRVCGAAKIRSMSEPTGPGFTTENRAWYWLNLELIF